MALEADAAGNSYPVFDIIARKAFFANHWHLDPDCISATAESYEPDEAELAVGMPAWNKLAFHNRDPLSVPYFATFRISSSFPKGLEIQDFRLRRGIQHEDGGTDQFVQRIHSRNHSGVTDRFVSQIHWNGCTLGRRDLVGQTQEKKDDR